MKRVVIPIHRLAVDYLGIKKTGAVETASGIGPVLAEALRDETIPVERLRFDEESQFFFVTVDIDFESPLEP